MGKKKRWQFFLILAVALLTIYNILPTVFYYSKPLKAAIDAPRAEKIAEGISERVGKLQPDSVNWLEAYCKHSGVSPQSVETQSGLIKLSFKEAAEAQKFKRYWPQAGNLIPFAPARLAIAETQQENSTTVYVLRQLITSPTPEDFEFSPLEQEGAPEKLFQDISFQRAAYLIDFLAGNSSTADKLLSKQLSKRETFFLSQVADRLSQLQLIATKDQEWVTSYLNHLFRHSEKSAQEVASRLLDALESQESSASNKTAIKLLKANSGRLASTPAQVISYEDALQSLENSTESSKSVLTFSLNNLNPFFSSISIDWETKEMQLQAPKELVSTLEKEELSEVGALKQEAISKLLYHEIAELALTTREEIKRFSEASFSIPLTQLSGATGILAMNLNSLAGSYTQNLQQVLGTLWAPKSNELAEENYPILSYNEYTKKSLQDQQFGFVLYSPASHGQLTQDSPFKSSSIYLIAKGVQPLFRKLDSGANQQEALVSDLQSLSNIFYQLGFIRYAPEKYNFPKEFENDLVFELPDFANLIARASREDFLFYPKVNKAILELSDVENRILVENHIGSQEHEDLLAWKEEYQKAQVSPDTKKKMEIPPPTRSTFFSNLALSTQKYFRGDNRKILAWGMDLSGGKSVQIGLKDLQNNPVTGEAELKEAVDELYQRLNRLGVSEVTPHIEGNTIVVDFPGSQDLSAEELINASTMTFHIVNERFAPSFGYAAVDSTVEQAAQNFLQEVWNEGLVTNRTDVHSLQEIAFSRFQAISASPEDSFNNNLKTLYDAGLRIADPNGAAPSNAFDDALSTIARFRGEQPSSWKGQTHPLIFVFHNYALQGRDIENVRADYSASEGNTLGFSVKSSYTDKKGESFTPQKSLQNWTAPFAASKVAGSDNGRYNGGNGWRMVTILNGSIVNMASIKQPLSASVQVSGNFSQSEVNRLVADLKAGSLSYIPEILAETNVSPELGKAERQKGITAAFIGLLLVVGAMVWYYRFGGIVASVALLFNLLIIWGALQNINAALTLEGIAGIILTMGMAVDANVLVFERIREEFAKSKRLAQAVHAGYRRAFTAIFDSNLTTIIAAIILLNFDSGPIKGFAVTLIIGIISSMFTSLFMTRFFFARWVENPCHKSLNMSSFITEIHWDFIKKAKLALTVAVIVIVVGLGFGVMQKRSLLGMDFTGGYAVALTLDEETKAPESSSYRAALADAFTKAGANPNNFMVRTLNKPNQLRVQFAKNMELPGQPFHDLNGDPSLGNPKILWVTSAIDASGLKLHDDSMNKLENSWVSMSGQLSDAMRNEAIIGLLLAMICILCYITFRFEFKYAVASIVALAHDCIITFAILAILKFFGLPIQINLPMVAAVMTIIGYSLNDTIIIFDRIREDLRIYRKLPLRQVVNQAISVTLSRTILTSGTTLLVLLALLLLGGSAIFEFSLVMTIGVIVGTFSSIFVASPVMLFFHRREKKQA